MTEHDGGPQPVADDVWVEFWSPAEGLWRIQSSAVDWASRGFCWSILNQHLIDAALRRGIELGLEAAAKEVAEKVEERIGVPCPDGIKGCAVFHFRRTERDRSVFEIKHHLKTLDPETIAKEAEQ